MALRRQVLQFRIIDYKNLSNEELEVQCVKIDNELKLLNKKNDNFVELLYKTMQTLVKANYAYKEAVKRAGITDDELSNLRHSAKLDSLFEQIGKN